MKGLTGRIALITGAASPNGLGFATARRLAAEGAAVVITDLDANAVEARAAELRAGGADALALAQDVTQEADWQRVMDALLARHGRLDILVNNAGIAVLKWMDAMTTADWRRQLAVNLDSVYFGCKIAIDRLRAQGGGGAIVNLSSIAGIVGVPGTAAYAASKGGIRAMTKTLAMETAREGIRVNSVHPGVIRTDMQDVALRDNPGQFDLINASIPMGRMGTPDDIGAMIAFLASDDACYITGAEFVVDGGVMAQ